MTETLVGRRVRGRESNSDGSLVNWTARIVREGDGFVTVRIPDRVRRLPFPPGGRLASGLGPKLVRYSREAAQRALVAP